MNVPVGLFDPFCEKAPSLPPRMRRPSRQPTGHSTVDGAVVVVEE